MTGRTVVIQGRVQGVGFRAFVLRVARAHGVTGSVRNRADGTVEARVTGTDTQVTAFVADLSHGPGRIDLISAISAPPQDADDFRIV